ncbi:MAG: putative quinol monooxygenase [Dehalococcoidia bacterium]
MLTVVAKLQAAPGKESQLKDALTKMVAAVSTNEKGPVVTYSVHVANDDPTMFLFYEQYTDDDAVKAHGATEHMGALNSAIRDGQLLAGRPTIERFTWLAGIS